MVMASLLTGVYLVTRSKIVEQKQKEEKEALREVMPEAKYFDPIMQDGEILYFKAYTTDDKERLLGYAFRAQGQGYSSVIETMAAMDKKGKLTGIRILSQNETPGLGARISEVLATKTFWQALVDIFNPQDKTDKVLTKPWFCEQFKGKKVKNLIVTKEATDKNIQAITGATISSEALTNSVRKKAEEVLNYE